MIERFRRVFYPEEISVIKEFILTHPEGRQYPNEEWQNLASRLLSISGYPRTIKSVQSKVWQVRRGPKRGEGLVFHPKKEETEFIHDLVDKDLSVTEIYKIFNQTFPLRKRSRIQIQGMVTRSRRRKAGYKPGAIKKNTAMLQQSLPLITLSSNDPNKIIDEFVAIAKKLHAVIDPLIQDSLRLKKIKEALNISNEELDKL